MSRPLHSEPTRPKELWRVFPSGSCQAQWDVDVHVGCATHAQLSRCVQSSHSVTGRSPTRGLRKFCEYKPLLYNGSYSKNVGSETGNRTKQSLVSFGDRGLPTQRERRPNELWRRFLRRGGQSAAQEETTDQRRQAGRCEREGGGRGTRDRQRPLLQLDGQPDGGGGLGHAPARLLAEAVNVAPTPAGAGRVANSKVTRSKPASVVAVTCRSTCRPPSVPEDGVHEKAVSAEARPTPGTSPASTTTMHATKPRVSMVATPPSFPLYFRFGRTLRFRGFSRGGFRRRLAVAGAFHEEQQAHHRADPDPGPLRDGRPQRAGPPQ